LRVWTVRKAVDARVLKFAERFANADTAGMLIGLRGIDGRITEFVFSRMAVKGVEGAFLGVFGVMRKAFENMEGKEKDRVRACVEGIAYGIKSRDCAMRMMVERDRLGAMDEIIAGAETDDLAGISGEVITIIEGLEGGKDEESNLL
jgi:hypothetical protein